MYRRGTDNRRTTRPLTRVKASFGPSGLDQAKQRAKRIELIDLRQAILDCLNSSLPCSVSFSAEFFSDALAELYWVISGVKHNAQVYVSEALLNRVVAACEAHALYYWTSPGAWIGKASSANPSYYNLSIEVSAADKIASDQRLRQIFITREKNEIRAHGSLHTSQDIERGNLLGYPNCCTRFFNECWQRACSNHEGDVTPFVIANSQGEGEFPFQTNHLTGLFGVPLVSHFPCSFSCGATIKQTDERLMKLRHKDPELAESITQLMKCPFLYSERLGAALIMNWTLVVPNRISFTSVCLTDNSHWDKILKVTDFIESDQHGRVALLKGEDRNLLDQETIIFWR